MVWKVKDGKDLSGFILVRRTREKGVWIGSILDVLARDPGGPDLHVLSRAALSRLFDEGLSLAKVILSSHSAYWRAFRQAGYFHFFRPEGNANVLSLGHPGEFDPSLVSRGSHLTGGDTDYIEWLD